MRPKLLYAGIDGSQLTFRGCVQFRTTINGLSLPITAAVLESGLPPGIEILLGNYDLLEAGLSVTLHPRSVIIHRGPLNNIIAVASFSEPSKATTGVPPTYQYEANELYLSQDRIMTQAGEYYATLQLAVPSPNNGEGHAGIVEAVENPLLPINCHVLETVRAN